MKLWDSAVPNDRIMHCAGGMLSRMDMAAVHGVFARGRLTGKDKEARQKTWIKDDITQTQILQSDLMPLGIKENPSCFPGYAHPSSTATGNLEERS